MGAAHAMGAAPCAQEGSAAPQGQSERDSRPYAAFKFLRTCARFVELSSAEVGLKNAWDVCQDELCKKAKIVRLPAAAARSFRAAAPHCRGLAQGSPLSYEDRAAQEIACGLASAMSVYSLW
jgi:hypothetical protein